MINKPTSLYIHIPFCDHICNYCDFAKVEAHLGFKKKYLESLFLEIDNKNILNNSLKTIYIGGGTPTSLDLDELESLLKKVSPLLNLNSDYEFTIESNVERVNESLITLLNQYHVNRISLGVQAFDDDVLKYLGRTHSKLMAINVVKLLKKHHFTNINIDLIYGFNGLSINTLKEELKTYVSLDVNHISTYSLILEDHTVFKNMNIVEMEDSEVREQYDLILNELRRNGYIRYEVSNFAKPGYQSKHNIVYWKDQRYYAVGLAAASYVDDIRYINTRNLNDYIANKYVASIENVSLKDDINYFLMLNLRLEEGFALIDYKNRFNADFLTDFKDSIPKLINDGLLIIDKTRVKASDEGMMLLDIILRALFK